MSDLKEYVEACGHRAKRASHQLALIKTDQKNKILLAMAEELESSAKPILEENQKDVADGKQDGLTGALIDRLTLDDARFASMVQGLRELAEAEDFVGTELSQFERPNGLVISKVCVPVGVIGMIFESRPNVTADAAGLCFRSSNAVILRGGKESSRSNKAICDALIKGGKKEGLPDGAIQLLERTEREGVKHLVQLVGLVDLVVPRGGEGLIRAVADMAKVPVLKHYKGVCHIYVDKSASLKQAIDICINAKAQRPSACNAMETLLVDSEIAQEFLPAVITELEQSNVELLGDSQVCKLVAGASLAKEVDWDTEYLDLKLSIKIVDGVTEAIDHINQYGSLHTEAILAEDQAAITLFESAVDAGVIMVNASTRFNDGSEFGMGAEIGISTDKIHARGPVGAQGLTTYKYLVRGEGQIRQ